MKRIFVVHQKRAAHEGTPSFVQHIHRVTPSGKRVPVQDPMRTWQELVAPPTPSPKGGYSADPGHPSRKHDVQRERPLVNRFRPGRKPVLGHARRRERRAAQRARVKEALRG